ncbi:retrovirus-related Pol polyprotein from transposon opus [Trichonephila clavipes]|uniref:RNA-directed DNA polymerase n=1 Tax=Trichonephila clavipes TaxID=2585209 RepID=A0A8X6RXU7_TRICX|nr:retrovirus-related Pol polyprotein from transposon opus [Trichonephila clavipes]
MTSETVEVARIALRLPPFWKSNVRLWIAQCDHAFTFSGISSDDTKYSALVANLDAETLSYVSDIVLSPPNSDKYHTLSQRLITQFSDSETQKIKKLLNDLQLGDEKPSHLLRKMKELSNGQLQDDFLQSLWLQRMPPHIQTVLSASSEPLDKLAIIADKVSDVGGASSTICAATTVPPPSQSSSCSAQPTMDSLAMQIQELSLQVAELTRDRNSSRHQRYSSDRRRSHSRSTSVNRGSGICYYHRRYKEQARKCVSPCAFVQKKRVSSVIAGMAEPSQHTSRLFLLDRKSGQKFLIDSGSKICVIPPSPTMNKSPQSNFSLFAANNTKIPAYGIVRKKLNLGLRRPFIWTFIIADVSSPIIGADFLKHFNLLIDLKKKRLVDVETSLFTPCVFSNIVQPSILTVDANISFKNILSEYPDLSNPSLISKSASHGTVHHIITTGPPVTARPRRLHPKLYDAVKVEFEFLLAQGIIRPSKSPWSSPLHVVPKSDFTVRPVGDYRQLNSVTEFDSYPMPYLNDFAHALHGKKIFSKIDIFKAFHQIPIAECDIPQTAVTTPWGLYEYTHLCFGLVNAPQTFMRFMHEVLRGLPFCFVYLDDILCYSENAEEHRSHLRTIFQRLSSYGLKLNISKCVFGVTELIFLGHLITPDGIKPLPDKVQAVLDYKQPETVGSLRKFLGLLNFYRRFLPKAAEQQYLLSEFLKGSKGKKDSKPLNWSSEAITAFQRCKQALADAALLAHPSPYAPLALHVDASDYAIGGALHQVVDSELQPLAFFSRKLTSSESLTVPTTVNSLLPTRLSDTFGICQCLTAWLLLRWIDGATTAAREGCGLYHVRVTNVGGKIRSEYLPFRTPISLTSTLCKLMERVIHRRLMNWLIENKKLHFYQTAFRTHHSTTNQLFYLSQSIIDGFQEKPRKKVFLDISAAFDRVRRQKLVHTIQGTGINCKALLWINNFIRGRKFSIRFLTGHFENLAECGLEFHRALS